MSKIKSSLNIKKLYRSINWDHKLKTDMLEPVWKPNIVKTIESGDKVVNEDDSNVAKKERRKAEKKRRNSQGCNKPANNRNLLKRIKAKTKAIETFIEKVDNE